MKVTFLIGNGFDLRQGLKTAYKDFIKYYTKTSKKDNDAIKKLKQNIKNEPLLWADFELLLGEITKYYSMGEKDEFMEGMRDMRHKMSAYLRKQSKKFKFKTSKYRKELKYSLKNLFCNEGYMYPPKEIFPTSAENKYQFIVFNYNTIIFDIVNKIRVKEMAHNCRKITENIKAKKNLIHCDTKDGFILGVNDCSQIINQEFRNDEDICNLLVKSNQRRIMYREKDVFDYVKDTDIVYVYGMSIGETDKRCWEQLINWLNINSKNKLILSYYDKDLTGIDLAEIQHIKDEYINRLLRIGLNETTIGQIEVVINPKIFNFARRTKNRI